MSASQSSPRRVVVYDDDADVRMVVSVSLSVDDGYEVVGEAATAAECLGAVRRTQPELIVMDLGLNETGGLALIADLHRITPWATIVVFTARGDRREEAEAQGATGYVVKGSVGGLMDALASAPNGTKSAVTRVNLQRSGVADSGAWLDRTFTDWRATDVVDAGPSLLVSSSPPSCDAASPRATFAAGSPTRPSGSRSWTSSREPWNCQAAHVTTRSASRSSAPSRTAGATMTMTTVSECGRRLPGDPQRLPGPVSGYAEGRTLQTSAPKKPPIEGPRSDASMCRRSRRRADPEVPPTVRRLASRTTEIEVPFAVARLDADLAVIAVNQAWRVATVGLQHANGNPGWHAFVHPRDTERVAARLRRAIETGAPATIEARGSMWAWIEIHARPGGNAGGVAFAVIDISAHKQREEALAYTATHDPLTGLHNRVALLERVQDAVHRLARQDTHAAVLFLDLDQFKEVNDTFGHAVGDKVLATLAARLQRAVRPADVIGRIGGDEFVVVCEGLTVPVEASLVARRLVDAVKQMRNVDEHPLELCVSIGIAFATGPGDDAATLIAEADRAMYIAKERGDSVYSGPLTVAMPLPTSSGDVRAAGRALTGALALLEDAELEVARHQTVMSASNGDHARSRIASRHIRRAIAILRASARD